MKKLQEYYAEYHRIWSSYHGVRVTADWKKVFAQLNTLYLKITYQNIRESKDFSAYTFKLFVKRELRNLVKDEMDRVHTLALKQLAEESEK